MCMQSCDLSLWGVRVDETAAIGSAFYGGDIAHATVSSILVEPLVFGSSPSNKNMQL
jgi:hypothetical protein